MHYRAIKYFEELEHKTGRLHVLQVSLNWQVLYIMNKYLDLNLEFVNIC